MLHVEDSQRELTKIRCHFIEVENSSQVGFQFQALSIVQILHPTTLLTFQEGAGNFLECHRTNPFIFSILKSLDPKQVPYLLQVQA